MNFRRCIFAAFAVLVAASPTFAAVPLYVEGEAIVMMRTDEARAELILMRRGALPTRRRGQRLRSSALWLCGISFR